MPRRKRGPGRGTVLREVPRKKKQDTADTGGASQVVPRPVPGPGPGTLQCGAGSKTFTLPHPDVNTKRKVAKLVPVDVAHSAGIKLGGQEGCKEWSSLEEKERKQDAGAYAGL